MIDLPATQRETHSLAAAPLMPELSRGTHAMRHTVDSALSCLAAINISASRLHVRRIGHSALPAGTIVAQAPAAGTPLEADVQIRLDVSGLGFTHALPIGMWDSGGEAEPGTSEMLEGIDDPLVKLTHWAHEGAALFRISNTDMAACQRWIHLFGVDARPWPAELWFQLASLLPQLHAVASSEEGMRFVLDILFGIPLESLSYRRADTPLPADSTTLLGSRASLLGVNTVAGNSAEDMAGLRLGLGPVSLSTYEAFAEGAKASLLSRALDYILPAFLDYELVWTVEDKTRCPRLGIAEYNGRLGVNSHMGTAA